MPYDNTQHTPRRRVFQADFVVDEISFPKPPFWLRVFRTIHSFAQKHLPVYKENNLRGCVVLRVPPRPYLSEKNVYLIQLILRIGGGLSFVLTVHIIYTIFNNTVVSPVNRLYQVLIKSLIRYGCLLQLTLRRMAVLFIVGSTWPLVYVFFLSLWLTYTWYTYIWDMTLQKLVWEDHSP